MTLYITTNTAERMVKEAKKMSDAQAKEITRLNEELTRMHTRIDEYREGFESQRLGYDYYMMLQKAALSDENVMAIWNQLLLMVRLLDEEGAEVKGLNAPDPECEEVVKKMRQREQRGWFRY